MITSGWAAPGPLESMSTFALCRRREGACLRGLGLPRHPRSEEPGRRLSLAAPPVVTGTRRYPEKIHWAHEVRLSALRPPGRSLYLVLWSESGFNRVDSIHPGPRGSERSTIDRGHSVASAALNGSAGGSFLAAKVRVIQEEAAPG